MKVGVWLSDKEALDYSLVDEITDFEDEPPPRLTDTLTSAMASLVIIVTIPAHAHLTDSHYFWVDM